MRSSDSIPLWFLLIGAVLLIGILMPRYYQHKRATQIGSGMRSDFRHCDESLKRIMGEKPTEFTEFLDAKAFRFNGAELYYEFGSEEDNLVSPVGRWEQRSSISDGWGNPLQFAVRVSVDGKEYRIKKWSTGANGIDETGGGDDVEDKETVLKVEGGK
jgi:hypothetical protein